MQMQKDVADERKGDYGDGDDDADGRSRTSAGGAMLDDDFAADVFVVFIPRRVHAQRPSPGHAHGGRTLGGGAKRATRPDPDVRRRPGRPRPTPNAPLPAPGR